MTQLAFDFEGSRQEDSQRRPAPASDRQVRLAHGLAARKDVAVPDDVLADTRATSRWIDAHAARSSRFDAYPSSRQVAFAEIIARKKRRAVPDACFRDCKLMSRWIDSNR